MGKLNISELDLNTKSLDCAFKIPDLTQLQALVDRLLNNTSVISLDLSGNKFGDSGCQVLASLLSQNFTIGCLKLNNNKISDKGLKCIVDAVTDKSNLSILTLGENKISDAGIKYLSHQWINGQNNELEIIDLDFDGNLISDDGCLYLIQCMEKCKSRTRLENVTMHHNEIKDKRLLDRMESILVKNQEWNSCNEGTEEEEEAEAEENFREEASHKQNSTNKNDLAAEKSNEESSLKASDQSQVTTKPAMTMNGSTLVKMSSARRSGATMNSGKTLVEQQRDFQVQLQRLQSQVDEMQRQVSNTKDQVTLLWRLVVFFVVAFVMSVSYVLSPIMAALLLGLIGVVLYFILGNKKESITVQLLSLTSLSLGQKKKQQP